MNTQQHRILSDIIRHLDSREKEKVREGMGLPEAVSEIADQMESDVSSCEDKDYWRILIKGYARQIRSAIKSSEGNQKPHTQANPELQKFLSLGEELPARYRSPTAKREMALNSGLAELIDPDSKDSTYVPIDPMMPVGAKISFEGKTYELREDSNLHRVES